MVEYNRYAVDNVDEYGRTPLMYATIKNKVCFFVQSLPPNINEHTGQLRGNK